MKYLKTSEALNLELEMYDILNQLSEDGNRVATFLINLGDNNLYADNEDLNVLAVSPVLNMVKFKPLKYRRRFGLFEPQGMEDIRFGRAIRKIYDEVKKKVNCDLKGVYGWIVRYPDDKPGVYSIMLKGDPVPVVQGVTEFTLIFDNQTLTPRLISSDEVGFIRPGLGLSWQQIKFEYDGDLPSIELTTDISIFNEKTMKKFDIKMSLDIKEAEITNFVAKFMGFLGITIYDAKKNIKLVKGNEIGFWYNKANMASMIGELGSSCMVKDGCETFFEIYKKNPHRISLLIMLNSENKLLARALVWKLDDGRIYMDRIYADLASNKYALEKYALDKGWLIYQRDYSEEMTVSLKKWAFKKYPHLDTFQYLHIIDGKLGNSTQVLGGMNSIGDLIQINRTDGKFVQL